MSAEAPHSAAARSVMDRPAAREVVPHFTGESFRWSEHDYPAPLARWNYHPEVEIHLIRKGTGSYIIGDQIGAFGEGHVAIVGPGLPHDWISDVSVGEVIHNRDAVIHLSADWLDRTVDAIPEIGEVIPLVHSSGRGIVFSGATAAAAAEHIEAVGSTEGAARVSHLLRVLSILATAPASETHYVAEKLYSMDASQEGKAAVDAGLAYVLENLTGHIRMSEAARLAYMSEPSFSKYFKKAAGMTFSDMVKRLRIASACRLLDQTEASVADISSSVGYRNLANFNRQFRAETGMTPRAYRALEQADKPTYRLPGVGSRT